MNYFALKCPTISSCALRSKGHCAANSNGVATRAWVSALQPLGRSVSEKHVVIFGTVHLAPVSAVQKPLKIL